MSLLTATEAAERLTLCPNTLAKMRIAGNGPRFLKLGRSVRYQDEDLKDWIDSRSVRSTSERIAA